MKKFNITGSCSPDRHYMVNLDSMIDNGDYFIINRGRQYGKTTTLFVLENYLKDNYIFVSMDFQFELWYNFISIRLLIILNSWRVQMGNIISFNNNVAKNDDSLVMSNGLTDILIDLLLINGSELAHTESQKRIIVFIAEKQQAIVGIGTVGFEIVEMPWQVETFNEDKKFILNVISNARQKKWWKNLNYEPKIESLEYILNGFERLIERMTIDNISENNLNEWLSYADKDDPIYNDYPKCPKHNVFLSCLGCKFCNYDY